VSITAPELKRWLYRYISEFAGEHEDSAGQVPGDQHYHRTSAAALERLAEYVQPLPDDDERLVRLAAAYPQHQIIAELASPNLQAHCASPGDSSSSSARGSARRSNGFK
jgi:hypothetical protein